MIKKKYDAIFCDLGNVLIDFDHKLAVRKILSYTSKKENDIYQLFFDSGITKLYEEGEIDSGEFFQMVKDSLGLDIGPKVFFPIWNDIFFETGLNKNIHNLLKKLKGKYKLIMMSNINKSHFEFLKTKMQVFKVFDKLILSYEVGFRKPAFEIYKAGLKAVGSECPRVFYIDDRKDLIEAAMKFGIKGIVLDGEEAFEKIEKELV
jgi:FMN phosphatase YigB (HAD superfamily)